MASQFYYGNDMQDLLLACMLQMRSEFHVLSPLVKPEYMWGMEAMRVAAAMQDYHEEQGIYPGLVATDNYLHEKYSRDKADLYVEAHDYIEKLKKLDTKDWQWVKKVTIKFCKERALICAIKEAADMVKTNKVPEGGFTPMFDKAMSIGQVLEPSDTLIDLMNRPKDKTSNLMGNRFFYEGGSLFINGSTGVGKSSLAMQFAIHARLRRPFFGIPFKRSLSVLIIQNENDEEDILEEVGGIVDGLDLNEKLTKFVMSGIRVRTVDALGDEFLAEFEMRLRTETKPGNVVIVDPLLGFFSGGDIRTAKDAAKFVRQGILRLARKYKVGLVCIHHTNKPPTQKNQAVELNGTDLAYLGSGSADIANACRASIALQSTGCYDIFRLSLGKRAQRADFMDIDGKPCKSVFIRHSKKGICWELANEDDKEKLEEEADNLGAVLNLVPEEGASIDTILHAAGKRNKRKIGQNTCRSLLGLLVEKRQIRFTGGAGHEKKRYYRIPGAEALDPVERPLPAMRPGRRTPARPGRRTYTRPANPGRDANER